MRFISLEKMFRDQLIATCYCQPFAKTGYMDKNYWKEAYQHLWSASVTKEKLVKQMIIDNTGFEVLEIGLGAGNANFINGNAADNKMEKGGADLYIKEPDSYIEVTGPNVPVILTAPLWFRPDKLNNSFNKIIDKKGRFHFAFHLQDVKGSGEKLIRILAIDILLYERNKNNEFRTVNPLIRGREEKYIEFQPGDPALISFDKFLSLIK
jgi:hypothetical protein